MGSTWEDSQEERFLYMISSSRLQSFTFFSPISSTIVWYISISSCPQSSAVIPDATVLEEYAVVPGMKDLDVTRDTVTKVAGELSGAGGPGGVDAVALQHWLLRFGKDSFALREAVADFTRWMANSTPPWAAIRAIMANQLMALDKCPGVRPVGIGEIWRRLF